MDALIHVLSANTLEAGRPWPLGATYDGRGVNFAIFSAHATQIQLCIFDAEGIEEIARISLPVNTDQVWHGYLPGIGPGVIYGYRAFGPNAPEYGHRFNPHKLLIDPYAKQFTGSFRWSTAHDGFELNTTTNQTVLNKVDNSQDTYKAVVHHDDFDWEEDQPPGVPLANTILYEVHVKGFTMRHPEIPEHLRGTYEGVVSPAALSHLQRLGITAVSLLPIHQSIPEKFLIEKGLTNYWGYNTIGFFAPDRRFALNDPVREFKQMVKQLHKAGIEVILDVVYNHTAEGNHTGPTLSFRGLDNHSYYHLCPGLSAHYENFTGTGNSVNLQHPRCLQLVMDSLRYWITEMHVDGFRFDLAVTLARNLAGFNPHSSFLDCLRQDPVLSQVKLIAEPWDIGHGGYQTGHFPPGWSEWNDKYRDTIRAFWVRETASRSEVASSIAGSSELFNHHGRKPQASINFVTAHDGFTLHDVVSYNEKHNDANSEDNRDGSNDNRSWNCGIEGTTPLLAINFLRSKLKRALLATLLFSQGVPMILGGDELGRSQSGNNNAYCQDNEISWYDWENADESLIHFVAEVITLRQHYSQLHGKFWLRNNMMVSGVKDITWLNDSGTEMTPSEWLETTKHKLGILLGAEKTEDKTILLLLNAESSDWISPLPKGRWKVMLETARYPEKATEFIVTSAMIKARSLLLLELV